MCVCASELGYLWLRQGEAGLVRLLVLKSADWFHVASFCGADSAEKAFFFFLGAKKWFIFGF